MELLVKDLSCARGGVPVLAGLGFTLRAGQALILRGPNGAGKTTLLRTLAGLQPALSGDISVNPDDIALATHADGVKAALTVAENLAFWAAVFGQNDISPALTAMNLTNLHARPAAQLSAGQRRRLGLARLMVTGRKLWLLDEPTVSLDTASVALFSSMMTRHLTAGGMAIIATHVDLGLPQAQTLDLSAFKPRFEAVQCSP
jgi:heme exporter protein A